MDELKKLVASVTNRLHLYDWIKSVLFTIALGLVVSAVTGPDSIWSALSTGLGLAIGWRLTRTFTSKKPLAISLIHRHIGQTEYSLDLLDKPDLNVAEQMQLERIAARAEGFPYARLNKGLLPYFLLLLVSVGFSIIYSKMKNTENQLSNSILSRKTPEIVAREVLPAFRSATVRLTPPAYTHLPVKESGDMNVSALSGSVIEWKVLFENGKNMDIRLANSRGEELRFRKSGNAFEYRDRITGSGLYSIKGYWKDSLIYQSDFYRLEALPDLAPKILPASKELYQYHFLKDKKTIQVSAEISDDFLVKQAFIVATLARGSGENVKFREVKMPLSPSDFKHANLKKTIDLSALNFTPGDELYYYWAAVDNRQPEANFSKSDTYFIVYKDTAQIEEAELATMAVNVMPEYFRSQRQIIIDTEKLIAKRKKIDAKEFKSTSNEIGFDQKVLRLRYGQYLGEEFETSIGGSDNPVPDNGNTVDAFTHHSDGKGEGAEAGRAEPTHAEGHTHEHEPKEAGEKDPLAALMEQYTHAHDDAETNTFYEQSTRSLLKMALEQMWQSELHLRMYEPEKALPFENKALEYLKTAQQKARAYVKKSGYDPPPIKENEKRLTGELKDVTGSRNAEKQWTEKRTDELAAALLGHLDNPKRQQAHMGQLAMELSRRLVESGPFNGGLQNWGVIASLQKLVNGKALTSAEQLQLKQELYKRSNAGLQLRETYLNDRKLEAAFRKRLK
ncbi:DUF1761 domain-containing protein [Dyadobacter sp. MSC1_007]|jgi:hypothetical protein|uniref:DUF1761 domain-containing protein n=1 Tax=Dyadobacter sp. MSC1_007 TaxID=2909264 RepID=UPI00202FA109|nr:DUF1761 domain-containing protein [Dyadobacter sp. MSC1_007]